VQAIRGLPLLCKDTPEQIVREIVKREMLGTSNVSLGNQLFVDFSIGIKEFLCYNKSLMVLCQRFRNDALF
jgi:hypothetical protein